MVSGERLDAMTTHREHFIERIMSPYEVIVEWDEEASVWVASSEDVPGLATGGDTMEALIEKLKVVIPELLRENGLLASGVTDVAFAIKAQRTEHARPAA
jgi:predicted RNase H-like HicB family nuclease